MSFSFYLTILSLERGDPSIQAGKSCCHLSRVGANYNSIGIILICSSLCIYFNILINSIGHVFCDAFVPRDDATCCMQVREMAI